MSNQEQCTTKYVILTNAEQVPKLTSVSLLKVTNMNAINTPNAINATPDKNTPSNIADTDCWWHYCICDSDKYDY